MWHGDSTCDCRPITGNMKHILCKYGEHVTRR